MKPTRVTMIEMTLAKIGRSTKKWENRMPAAPSDGYARRDPGLFRGGCRRGGLDLAVLGLDLLPRPRPLQAIDDDSIGRRDACANDAQTLHHRTKLDQLGADGAVVGDGEDDLAGFIACDAAVPHHQASALPPANP